MSKKPAAVRALPVYDDTYATVSSKSHFRPRSMKWIADGWALEILSAIVGLALVVALVLVLHLFDQKPPPHLGRFVGSSVTVNTLVSILSTVAKAALLLPVAECVSQQKWIYFAGGYQHLSELSAFDKASRGVFGGLVLIWETKLMNVAALGALLMVYAIAIDPLSQQLVTTVTRMVPTNDSVATIPLCRSWIDTSSYISVDQEPQVAKFSDGISLPLKGAIYSGLYADTDVIKDLAPSCPGGQCTFEPYLSIAVCPSFADVSSNLRVVNETFNMLQGTHVNSTMYNTTDIPFYYVSTNQYVAAGLPFRTPEFGLGNITSAIQPTQALTGFYTFPDTVAFKESVAPIADFFIIYAVSAKSSQFRAVEVLLEWCLQNYTTVVSNATATTVRHNTFNATASLNFTIPETETSGVELPSYIDPQTHRDLQGNLAPLLSGAAWASTREQQTKATTEIAEALFSPFEPFTFMPSGAPWPQSDDKLGLLGTGEAGLEHMINNLATSMTNLVRTASNKNTTTPAQAIGTVLVSTEFIVIRWKWITVLATFTALSIVFLIISIARQSMSVLRAAAWKSSDLVVLHGLDPKLQQEYGGVDSHGLLFNRDQKLLVRLHCVPGEGWRLLAEPQAETNMLRSDAHEGEEE